MKKLIICEKTNPFLDSLKQSKNLSIVTSNSYLRVADGILFFHPDINNLILENSRNKKYLVIAIVQESRVQIFKALFKNLLVLSDTSTDITSEIIQYFTIRPDIEEIYFSEKEHVFLSEYSYGISLKEMCYVMNMSYRSIRRLRQRLLDKTGLVSAEQLTLFAFFNSLKHGNR